MRISFSDVQRNVAELANRQEYTKDILFELMVAYGRSASSITKLRNGLNNLAEDKETTVLQRQVVYFKIVKNYDSLPSEVEKLEQDPLTQRYNPRFIIVTDLKTFAAQDTKKGNTLEVEWADIDRNVDFFYGWTGDEVTDEKTEAAADRRAADKMKELYQEVEKVNLNKFKDKDANFRHHLNVFFTRLLFCLFAEDTRVFSKEEDNIFTSAIKDFTQSDGSDLDDFLSTLFDALDNEDKSTYTSPFSKFPYVNGRLFDKSFGIEVPKFNAQARKLILDCGALSWAEINPDIFGSMFQSIVDKEHRSTHGMHYTSVPNIMKTIEPLFLDELREEFDKNYDNPKKLQKLWDRISKIKVFDPACGSGNFLIIAYKELRKLEHAIIERIFEDEYVVNQIRNKVTSKINLDNFYGIEIDDFPVEVAILSLYLAKHQMNIEFEKQFGKEIKLIPLKDKANVVQGNAARMDWQEVCPNVEQKVGMTKPNEQSTLIDIEDEQSELELGKSYWEEIYLIGNPPYQGAKLQTSEQRSDFKITYGDQKYSKKLDYIVLWFVKGSKYIAGTQAKLAFVSTNSICQGEQVGEVWPDIFNRNLEIGFAYKSFKWVNSAKDNAGVSVVVISLRNKNKQSSNDKYIYDHGIKTGVNHEINGYLVDSNFELYITNRTKPISNIKPMYSGNVAYDSGHLIFNPAEQAAFLSKEPSSSKYFKKIIGGREMLHDEKRFCLWLDGIDNLTINEMPMVKDRVEKVRAARLSAKDKGTHKLANRAAEFRDKRLPAQYIAIPKTSTERREYIPMDFFSDGSVPGDSIRIIPDGELWLFAVLLSRIHMTWVRAVAGQLETRIRYSKNVVYNNFPLSPLTEKQVSELTRSAQEIIFARENHTEKTLAEMYDPDRMPDDLRETHYKNDLLVDKLYRQKPYENDEERLSDLFELYEEMTKHEEK